MRLPSHNPRAEAEDGKDAGTDHGAHRQRNGLQQAEFSGLVFHGLLIPHCQNLLWLKKMDRRLLLVSWSGHFSSLATCR